MGSIFKNIGILFTACRGYSLPISLMSWLIPFLFGLLSGGSLFSGLIALFGIVTLHMGTNIFDDAVDYTIAKKKIEKGIQNDFNFQKGKCVYIFNKELSLKQYYILMYPRMYSYLQTMSERIVEYRNDQHDTR